MGVIGINYASLDIMRIKFGKATRDNMPKRATCVKSVMMNTSQVRIFLSSHTKTLLWTISKFSKFFLPQGKQ